VSKGTDRLEGDHLTETLILIGAGAEMAQATVMNFSEMAESPTAGKLCQTGYVKDFTQVIMTGIPLGTDIYTATNSLLITS